MYWYMYHHSCLRCLFTVTEPNPELVHSGEWTLCNHHCLSKLLHLEFLMPRLGFHVWYNCILTETRYSQGKGWHKLLTFPLSVERVHVFHAISNTPPLHQQECSPSIPDQHEITGLGRQLFSVVIWQNQKKRQLILWSFHTFLFADKELMCLLKVS